MILIVAQFVKNFPAFYGRRYFILCPKVPATGFCSEQDNFIPLPHILFLSYFKMYFSYLHQDPPSVFFPLDFLTKFYVFFSPVRALLVRHISFLSVWLPNDS
jgi:hypothetical protein